MIKNTKIRKILAPTLPSIAGDVVTAWAEKMSAVFQAQLVLYNAVQPTGMDGQLYPALHGKKINQLLKSAIDRLQKLGHSLVDAHRVRYLVELSSGKQGLIQQARSEKADLLVAGMPPKGTSASGRLLTLMYRSPCPTMFVREGMAPPVSIEKILVPVRLKDNLEQKLPFIIALAKSTGARICLSSFITDGATAKEQLRLFVTSENMAVTLRSAGVEVDAETVQGYHFGTAMVQRAQQTGADLIAILVEPANYIVQRFNKMIGPYFLENSPVPVLSIPAKQTVGAKVQAAHGFLQENPAAMYQPVNPIAH